MKVDDILERLNLKYEDLNREERKTLQGWLEVLGKTQMTLDMVRTYIASMRDAVEQELTETGHNSKQDIFLKARLRNYMLLEAFMSTPEKAKRQLERTIASFASRKGG